MAVAPIYYQRKYCLRVASIFWKTKRCEYCKQSINFTPSDVDLNNAKLLWPQKDKLSLRARMPALRGL